MVARVGAGLVSGALGIAVAASQLQGAGLEIAAWSTVALGVSLMSAGPIASVVCTPIRTGVHRFRRKRSPDLASRLRRAGLAIAQFQRDRDAHRPTTKSGHGTSFWHPFQFSRARQAQEAANHAYDDDTLSLYDQHHAPIVRALVRELVTLGYIGDNEARELVNPCSVTAIEAVGRRLIALGALVKEGAPTTQ